MSNISGLWDSSKLIHKENIYLVKPKSSDLLNKAIKELLNNEILNKNISQNGRKLVENNFNSKNMSDCLKKLLVSIDRS